MSNFMDGEESTFSGEELFVPLAQADVGLDALFEVQVLLLMESTELISLEEN